MEQIKHVYSKYIDSILSSAGQNPARVVAPIEEEHYPAGLMNL